MHPLQGGPPARSAIQGVAFRGVSPPQAEVFGDLGSFRGVPAFRRVIPGGRIPGGPQTLEDALHIAYNATRITDIILVDLFRYCLALVPAAGGKFCGFYHQIHSEIVIFEWF